MVSFPVVPPCHSSRTGILFHNQSIQKLTVIVILLLLVASDVCSCFSFSIHDTTNINNRQIFGVIQQHTKYTTEISSTTKANNSFKTTTSNTMTMTTNQDNLQKNVTDMLGSRLKFTNIKEAVSTILLNNPTVVCDAFYNCPDDKFYNVISLTGKERFKYMLLKHPLLVANVLNTDNLKSKFNIIQLCLNLSETSLKFKSLEKKITPEIIRRITRIELTKKLNFLNYDIQQLSTSNGTNTTQQQTSLKILSSWPQYLSYSYIKVQYCKDFFLNDVGLSKLEFSKMICILPHVLAYSVDKNLRHKLLFLEEDLGCSKIQAKRITYRYPRFLSLSLQNLLRPKLRFLNNLFQPTESSNSSMATSLSKIITSFPPLLWLSDSNTLSKVQFLQDELQLTNDEMIYILSTMPQLLGLSLDNNLQPKINYLRDDKVLGIEKLKEFVVYQPALLGYSLEKRIKPRIEKMKEYSICFAYCQPYLMSIRDDKFNSWIDLHMESWSLAS